MPPRAWSLVGEMSKPHVSFVITDRVKCYPGKYGGLEQELIEPGVSRRGSGPAPLHV